MPSELATKWRAKYPGQYDDLDDATLESKVLAKFPDYKDLATPKAEDKAVEKPVTKPSLMERGTEFVNKHPVLRRLITGEGHEGENAELMKKYGITDIKGPGMMEIPGVKKGANWLADKVDPTHGQGDQILGNVGTGIRALGGMAAIGFDPRVAGIGAPGEAKIPLGPEDNPIARGANSLLEQYKPKPQLALPPATNPEIRPSRFFAGPAGTADAKAGSYPMDTGPISPSIGMMQDTPKPPTVMPGELGSVTQLPPADAARLGTKMGKPADITLKDLNNQTSFEAGGAVPKVPNPDEAYIGSVGPASHPSAIKVPRNNPAQPIIPPTNVPVPPKVVAPIPPPTVPASVPFSDRLTDWVGHRSWADVAGQKIKQQFAPLDNGVQGIIDFQKNPTVGPNATLSAYFTGKRAQLLNAGFEFGNKGESYLPQLWQDATPAQLQQAYGAKLGTRPTFTMPSVLDDYAQGIAAGLKPKFENISDLAGWYERTAEKGMADRAMWKGLKDNGEISAIKDEAHPVALDPNKVPIILTKGGAVNWYASPEIATKMNNVLGKAWEPLEKAANLTSTTKGMAMSIGVPGTGINPHGFSTAVRAGMASKGIVPGMASTLRDMVQPSHALGTVETAIQDGTMERAMKAGMSMNSKAYRLATPDESGFFNALGKISDKATGIFKKPLFDKVIPAAQINQFKDTEAELIKAGIDKASAARQAADFVNKVFVGKNTKAMGENPNFGAALRTIFFAPGYGRSNIDLAKGTVSALLNPSNPAGAPMRRVAMNTAIMYSTANLIQKALTNTYMWENDPMHSFDIRTGKQDAKGKDQYIRWGGSAADMPRIMSEVSTAFANGQGDVASQILKNRLSPGVRLASEVGLENENWKGDKILGKDKYGKPQTASKQIGNLGSTIADNVLPNSTRAITGLAEGSMSPEKAATQAIGMPISYASKPPVPKPALFPGLKIRTMPR